MRQCCGKRAGARRGWVLGLFFCIALGCSTSSLVESELAAGDAPTATALAEWQILEVKSGASVSFDDLMARLASQDVIYLGEEHHNRYHIEGAIRILQHLISRGRTPVVAMEMFAWDGQEALDRYAAGGPVDLDGFLAQAKWKENWGGEFSDYQALLDFARTHHLAVVAMNPPRPIVRKVARYGLRDALGDPEIERWGMHEEQMVDDPAYRELLTKQLRECHGGMPDEAYERIYQASMFRDEGMAKTIVASLDGRDARRGQVVSYTGGGHIQQGLPVPARVQRRRGGSVAQATVYMTSLERDHPEYVQELLENGIADYVWLTPIGEHGPPKRCG